MNHPIFLFYIDHRKMNLSGRSPAEVRSAADTLLLDHVFGRTASEHLVKGVHGKPEFENSFLPKETIRYFNLSHARDYSILAVSDMELGADIEELPEDLPVVSSEKRRKNRGMLAKKVFPVSWEAEYQNSPLSQEKEVFTRFWTQLEAILKEDGSGFTKSLKALNPQDWFVQTFSLEDHIISIAMKENFEIQKREELR